MGYESQMHETRKYQRNEQGIVKLNIYRFFFLMTLFLLTGCAHSQYTLMTSETFQETHVGMSEDLLVKTYGPPLNKYYRDNGDVVIYEYVERFSMGPAETRIVEARRYYFFIKNGKVHSRQMAIKNQPAYDQMNGL